MTDLAPELDPALIEEARMSARDVITDTLSHHMIRRVDSTQARCDCGTPFPLPAGPHLISGEMAWHLRDVVHLALFPHEVTDG